MNKRKVARLLYLETVLSNIIHQAVEEEINGHEVDLEKTKKSLEYHINEQI
jgi:hypothetical protein